MVHQWVLGTFIQSSLIGNQSACLRMNHEPQYWVYIHSSILNFDIQKNLQNFQDICPTLVTTPPKKSLFSRPIGIPKFLIASNFIFFPQFRSYGILLYVLIAVFVYLNLEQRSCCHKKPIETSAPSDYLFIYLFNLVSTKKLGFFFSQCKFN